jgi:hypothetical protein
MALAQVDDHQALRMKPRPVIALVAMAMGQTWDDISTDI